MKLIEGNFETVGNHPAVLEAYRKPSRRRARGGRPCLTRRRAPTRGRCCGWRTWRRRPRPDSGAARRFHRGRARRGGVSAGRQRVRQIDDDENDPRPCAAAIRQRDVRRRNASNLVWGRRRSSRKGISLVPEARRLFGRMTVWGEPDDGAPSRGALNRRVSWPKISTASTRCFRA